MKSLSIFKATFLGASLTALTLVVSSPAEAQTLKGRFGISGNADITRTSEPSPGRTAIRPTDATVGTATGDFANITLGSRFPKIKSLRLTETGTGIYEAIRINNFVTLGRTSIGGETGRVTFNTENIIVNRDFSGSGLNSTVSLNGQIAGVFEFKGKALNPGFATLTASNASGAETYELTLQTVPEPLTILGTIAAAGLLGVGKRELDKADAKKADENG